MNVSLQDRRNRYNRCRFPVLGTTPPTRRLVGLPVTCSNSPDKRRKEQSKVAGRTVPPTLNALYDYTRPVSGGIARQIFCSYPKYNLNEVCNKMRNRLTVSFSAVAR